MTLKNQEVDSVSKKILDDANLEKEKIINDAHLKEKEILTAAEDKRKRIFDDAKAQAEQLYKKLKDLEIASEILKLNQESLLSKIKFIDETADKAVKKIKASEKEKYLLFIKNQIKNLNIKKAEYKIGKNEKILNDKILNDISEGIVLELSDKPADFDNGIKITDGRKQYIISVEDTLKEKVDDIRMEISDFIFEKE